jgi:hypothetical protein
MKKNTVKKIVLCMVAFIALWSVSAPLAAQVPPRPGYVIITTAAIYDPLKCRTSINAFRDDKIAHGFDAYVKTEADWDTAPGASRPERLRRWLQDNRLSLNIEYVLLIGNPDPVSGDVPMLTTATIPTDFYYSELVTDPGVALPPNNQVEVMVGRIPFIISDPPVPGITPPITWLDFILRKTVRYNNETPLAGMWRRNAIIPIHPLCGTGHVNPADPVLVAQEHARDLAYRQGEKLKSLILFPNGIPSRRIYELDYGLIPPPETTPCDWDIVNNVWRGGQFGLAYWYTHGWARNADRVMLVEHVPGVTYDALDLNPDYPAFVFQDSCSNAQPEVTDNLAYAMLKNGALTTVAATRNTTQGGDEAAYYFYRLVTCRLTAGQAFSDMQCKSLDPRNNLYGDPSARYWLPLPYSIDPLQRNHLHTVGTGSINITADPGFAWQATSNDSWITVTTGATGVGNGTITYAVAANPTGVRRTGSITVGGYANFIVTQSEFVKSTELPAALPPESTVDFNNDGRMDIVLVGPNEEGVVLQRNDGPDVNGNSIFTPLTTNLPGLIESGLSWGDFDNDGLMDVLMAGIKTNLMGPPVPYTRLFRNTGAGPAGAWEFTEMSAGLPNIISGSRAWGDFDNDGDLDLLLTGHDRCGMSSGQVYTKLLRNDGSAGGNVWRFTEMTTALRSMHSGGAEWIDFDNDGRLDLALSGTVNFDPLPDQGVFKIYRNEGPAAGPANAWTFTEKRSTRVSTCRFACGDYDRDGRTDIALHFNFNRIEDQAELHNEINLGDTAWNFTRIDYGIRSDIYGQPVWIDYDNDGDLDLSIKTLIDGINCVKLYRNDLNLSGVFSDTGKIAPAARYFWADFDNDNDLDIVAAGNPTLLPNPHIVYKNNTLPLNSPPTAPAGLATSVSGNTATFTWNAANDGQTMPSGLTYNLYVGTTPGGQQERSPHADTTSGYRRIVKAGDVTSRNLAWTIKDLPGGRYWWSVQAIDTSYVGGPFALEQTFTVNPTVSGRVTNAGVGVAGVSIRGFPGGTVITDSNGYYAATVPYDWTGTALPYLAGGTWFTPGQRMYVRLMRDERDQDYAVGGTANLYVQYMTYRLDPVTDTIFVNVRVYNNGNADVSLKDVSFKYWYSSEWDALSEKVEIDSAIKMPSGTWVGPWTQARIDVLNPELGIQDRVQTTTFTNGAGVIKKNEFVEVHLRLHYNDMTKKYTQIGDFSFQNKTVFETTVLIPAYFRGSLVWGGQPQ